MTIDIITLFPDMFAGPFDESMVKRAQERKIVTIGVHNLRKWAIDARGTVDGHPYGGGAGMLLRPEPVFNAVTALKQSNIKPQRSKIHIKNQKVIADTNIVLLDAGGKLFNQEMAIQYSKLDHIICICGHYEGVDYRVHEMVDDVISIGDYVVTGGEIPAMILVDSIVRLLPGVLNNEKGPQIESFSLNMEYGAHNKNIGQIHKSKIVNHKSGLLEFPQYTRPEEFQGMKVPDVLLSGHHGEIEKWRQEQALERTKKIRPNLLRL